MSTSGVKMRSVWSSQELVRLRPDEIVPMRPHRRRPWPLDARPWHGPSWESLQVRSGARHMVGGASDLPGAGAYQAALQQARGHAIVNRRLTMTKHNAVLESEPAIDPAACCPPEDTQTDEVLKAPVEGSAADEELAVFAKAIAHPTRVRILRMLAKKEARMCSHIVDELPLAQSTVSEHLRILRSAGLVQANENGPRVSYCIVPSALNRLKALLEAV